MTELSYTLLSDGSSDRALIPILTWVLRQHEVNIAIQPQWADLRRLPAPPRSLSSRIRLSLNLFPCDLLFIHRDAEREPYNIRVEEIQRAVDEVASLASVPAICVVPVRMQEAWLLFNEIALRVAAGNPNGQNPLHLPPINTLEQLPDPKSILYELLREASGLYGRRRRKFAVRTSARRVSELITDFTPLRVLSAFNALETEVQNVIETQDWN